MGKDSNSIRRKLGIVFLVVPVGMLVLGQTMLKTALDGMAFLVYWLVCFGFTFAAMFVALVDIRALRRQTRDETRQLMQKTFGQIRPEEDEKPDLGA